MKLGQAHGRIHISLVVKWTRNNCIVSVGLDKQWPTAAFTYTYVTLCAILEVNLLFIVAREDKEMLDLS